MYGHTIDAWEQANFPDEHRITLRQRAAGELSACCHSSRVLDGELGHSREALLARPPRRPPHNMYDNGP